MFGFRDLGKSSEQEKYLQRISKRMLLDVSDPIPITRGRNWHDTLIHCIRCKVGNVLLRIGS